MVEDAGGRAPGRHESHADRQGDQQHHPGRSAADLRHTTGQERPATDHEHDRAEDGGDPGDPLSLGQVVPHQHREHLRESDDRNGQQEHPPEQSAELSDVVTMAGMALVPVGTVLLLVGVGVLVVGVLVRVLVVSRVRFRRGVVVTHDGLLCAGGRSAWTAHAGRWRSSDRSGLVSGFLEGGQDNGVGELGR